MDVIRVFFSQENLENGQVNHSQNPLSNIFSNLVLETYFVNWFNNVSEKNFSSVILRVEVN